MGIGEREWCEGMPQTKIKIQEEEYSCFFSMLNKARKSNPCSYLYVFVAFYSYTYSIVIVCNCNIDMLFCIEGKFWKSYFHPELWDINSQRFFEHGTRNWMTPWWAENPLARGMWMQPSWWGSLMGRHQIYQPLWLCGRVGELGQRFHPNDSTWDKMKSHAVRCAQEAVYK